MSNRIQIRRGTTTEWTAANPVLASGEPGLDTTLNLFKIGDGVTPWLTLATGPPRGYVGQVIGSTDVVTVGTTEVTVATANIPMVAGRRYEAMYRLHVQPSVGSDLFFVRIYMNAVMSGIDQVPQIAASHLRYATSETYVSTTTGNLPVALTLQRITGTGTCLSAGSTYYNSRATVKDIGV